MDLLRRWSTEAPLAQDAHDTKPTLLVSWWCTCFAITVVLFRFCGRYVRTEKVFREDGVMLLATIPLLLRMAFVHVILLYGTNNTTTQGLSVLNMRHRELGSKLVLASRIMYAAYLWTIKYSASFFLRSLTEQIWQRSHLRMLRYLHLLLGFTFLAVVISDLAECHPFQHYWQVVPDPGPQCRQGYAQFLTMTITNIVTNVALVAFPIPMIMKSRLSGKGKSIVILRMALPLIGVAVTISQIASVLSRHGDQRFRSLFASIDILVTTFIANAVALGSLLQDKGYKKSKYKHIIEIHGSKPKAAGDDRRGRDRWGSDENLMRSSNVELKEALSEIEMLPIQGLPSPAPRAKLQEIKVHSTWEIEVLDTSS
ncbi:MAG: hypothetical protein M1818_007192 [Claussenomyces sp. TS43310]|nr:MAG: hypothetical protein M1818_007192 [Claussenomyces sp. TS43310]